MLRGLTNAARAVSRPALTQSRFFSSTQRPAVKELADLHFTYEQFLAMTQILKLHGLKTSLNLVKLNNILSKHARTYGGDFSSDIDRGILKDCADKLGFTQSKKTCFLDKPFDAIVPFGPGINRREFLSQFCGEERPGTMHCIVNIKTDGWENQIKLFLMNLELHNQYLARFDVSPIAHQIYRVTPSENLPPALQEVDIAKRVIKDLKVVSNLDAYSLVINQPRAMWLSRIYQEAMKTRFPHAEIQLSSQGIEEIGLLYRCLPELACMVQVAYHQRREQEKNAQSFVPRI